MDYIEIIAAFTGLLYLWLEYKADIRLWIVGIFMSALYVYVFGVNKFYAIMGINIYYLFAYFYGWWKWKKGTSSNKEILIAHTSIRYIPWLVICSIAFFVAISFILNKYTDSTVVWGDAFITALSITGMWMLAHKLIEQWWIWIVVNAVSTYIYFIQGLYPTSVLFFIYTFVSLMGYFKWRKLMQKQ